MAATQNKAISPQSVIHRQAVCTLAEVTFHSPTNVVTLFDEGASGVNNPDGLRITSLYFITRATITTNPINCQLYLKSGTTYTLIDSQLIQPVAPAAGVANGKINFTYADDNPLFVGSGYGLAVAIGTAIPNGVVAYCSGSKY
jgi:hypothetical protein